MIDYITSALKALLAAVFTCALNAIMPIQNFLYVIAFLSTVNVIVGWIADNWDWKFVKAVKAGVYLGGYFMLLVSVSLVGLLMRIDEGSVTNITSWITWVMIWFYSTNVLRNWKTVQPDNKVVSFLYWVATVKFIEKINYLKEFKEDKK